MRIRSDRNDAGNIWYIEKGESLFRKTKLLKIKTPSDAIHEGIGFLKNRKTGKMKGLILDYSIRENISLPSIDGFKRNIFDWRLEKDFVELLMKRLNG